MLIPDLEQTLFWNGDSPIWNFFWRLPITEWGSLFRNGDPILEWFQIGDSFPESPIWNGNYSRMVSDWTVPILKQGCSHSPFWNGDPCFGTGIANCYVPISKQGSPFQNGEYWQPHSESGIMSRFWLLVVRDSKNRKKYSPCSEMGSPHSVMGRHRKKSKLGSPRSKKEFVTNRGLTYICHFSAAQNVIASNCLLWGNCN